MGWIYNCRAMRVCRLSNKGFRETLAPMCRGGEMLEPLQQNLFENEGLEKSRYYRGGFPCQPHSIAGKRQASSDERDLSDEFIRVICETRPKWVLGENVAGLLTSENGLFFGGFIRKLADLGYCVGWGSIRASWVGAVHQRERVFITAYNRGKRWDCLDKIKQEQLNKIFAKSLDHSEAWTGIDAKTSDIFYAGSRIISNGNGISLRNDDGLSEGVDRLKGLGNAVVPQQVYPFLAAISQIERLVYNEQQ